MKEAQMQGTVDGPAFLLRGAHRLASSVDLPVIASHAATLAVPVLGNACLVDLADERGVLVRTAEAYADPAAPSVPAGSSRLVVPLTGVGGCLGSMTFASHERGRALGPEQRLLARKLALLVAEALESAQLHEPRSECAMPPRRPRSLRGTRP